MSGQAFPKDFDENDRRLCLEVGPYTMTSPERVFSLARAVEHVVQNRVAGAVVECGVWRGGSMMAVALTLLRLQERDRDLHLFDTFSGMTEPGVEDVKYSGRPAAAILRRSSRKAKVWGVASLEEVRANVLGTQYPEERVHFVRGRVEETLPEHAPERVALLRLDTDWYASTRHELEHLYPRVASGGVVIVDDYGFWKGSRKAVDEYFRAQGLAVLLHRVDDEARMFVKS
jgi:O-methyltransferase